MSALTYAYVGDITKAERDENGDLLVYGKATGPDLDLDEQRCDPAWLRKAMPSWAEWSNIREMHQPICAGVGMETEERGDDWWVKSKVVDPATAKKIEAGALRGYSIGIKNPTVVKDATAPGGRIVSGDIVEISYVDRPCNPDATMAICKAVGADGKLAPVEADEAPELSIHFGAQKFSPADLAKLIAVKAAAAGDAADSADQADAAQAPVAESAEQEPPAEPDAADDAATEKSAATAVDKGAMAPLKPGGKPRYPIETVQDLKDAIQAFGRGKDSDKDEIKAHIKSEAKRLGRSDLIPDNWKAALSKAVDGEQMTHDPAELKAILGGLVNCMKAELDELVDGENELSDLYDLLCTIKMFCRWWASEALGGETAEPYDMGDTMTYIGLEADADTTKTADTDTITEESTADTTAEETVDTEDADSVKTTEPDTTKTVGSDADHLTELVKSLVAEEKKALTEAAEERTKALAAELETVKAELAKVSALPESGGPVVTRTAAQQAAARDTDAAQLQAQADVLKRRADSATDPYLRQGYKERYAELMAKAAQ